MSAKFTKPKTNKTSKYWYVHYRYEGKQFRETYGLNKIKDLKIRELEYNILCKTILLDLSNGWNPNLPKNTQLQSDMFIVESLRFALEKKKENISKKTHSGYDGTINFIENAVAKAQLQYLKIKDIKRFHIKMIMENAKQMNEWTNKSYNKHLNHLKAILSELVQWDIIENNPAFNVRNLTVEESIAHIPPTDQEMNIIKTELNFSYFSLRHQTGRNIKN
jgi:hypothetical protein